MVVIVFETHATSLDNETRVASGHHDVDLSDLGRRQATALGARYADDRFAVVFCSDLRRSYRTAELAFGSRRIPIVRDPRLRECDYGDLTRYPSDQVEREKPRRVLVPFPRGESYEQAAERVRSFLRDLAAGFAGQRVLVIGHRATQYGLEPWLNGVPLTRLVAAPWTWQPGSTYELVEV
jgi:broad specificity phosphatase PhoE